jgi:glutathione peroxidase
VWKEMNIFEFNQSYKKIFLLNEGSSMFKLSLGLIMMLISNLSAAACSSIYNHQFNTLQGQTINLCDYQDKPILVVNTASKCGFTPQFEDLEAIYRKYHSKLLVIGFPSNDFNQELSSNKEIGDFCKNTYKVEFPMVTKTSVTGHHANPLHKELIEKTGLTPTWNFYKYVILPGGEKVYGFSSDVKPNDPDIWSLLKPYLQ